MIRRAMVSNVEKGRGGSSLFVKGRQKTGGRTKGTLNRLDADVKSMILRALHQAGGTDYLAQQAKENPSSFLALVGKILPRDDAKALVVGNGQNFPRVIRITISANDPLVHEQDPLLIEHADIPEQEPPSDPIEEAT